jgi:maltose O-acetyltransferase
MNDDRNLALPRPEWTSKKIFCYFAYRFFAKHLPEQEEFRFVGTISSRLRTLLCRPLFRKSADVITVGRGANFGNGSSVIMEDHSNIGPYALIEDSGGTVTIGRHVMMGKYCIILSQNHKYLEEGFDGYEAKDVVIKDHAWIGHRVTILPGVVIGAHAIIGAGSVVSRNIPDYAIAVGNPAKVKKFRKEIKDSK